MLFNSASCRTVKSQISPSYQFLRGSVIVSATKEENEERLNRDGKRLLSIFQVSVK